MNVEGKELGLRVKWGSYYTWAKVHPPFSYHTITTTHSFRHNIWFTKYVFSLVSMPLTMEILEISKIFVTIIRDKTICSINHSIWELKIFYLIPRNYYRVKGEWIGTRPNNTAYSEKCNLWINWMVDWIYFLGLFVWMLGNPVIKSNAISVR